MDTARTVPTFEIPTADDMDLHSDNDIDYNDDGDIELDLEPPPNHGQDDDMSINDAASVPETDAQEAPEQQDDYMVDPEDIIEEDYDDQGVDTVATTDQPPIRNAVATQAQAPVDDTLEDLIDYADEEDLSYSQIHNSTAEPSLTAPQYYQYQQPKGSHMEQDEIPADMRALMSVDDNKPHSPYTYAQTADHTPEGQEEEERHHSARRQSYHSVGANEEYVQTDGGDGGNFLESQEERADNEGDHRDAPYEDYVPDESAGNNKHQDQDASGLPSVTVNYEGNELWLFKQHDDDSSGDWLIEDFSLAKASMSDLFRAFRSSLGDDVSNESEIGFRFEHLQNIELFEDTTACVAVSLERLVKYYHTLLAQDGISEPDSFYISVLIRPRFLTLLSDIAKFADQGSGCAALEAAVAAGETHFSTMVSSASSEEHTEWGNEEQEQDQANGEVQEQVDGEVQEQAEGEVQEQAEGEVQEQAEGEGQGQAHGEKQDPAHGEEQEYVIGEDLPAEGEGERDNRNEDDAHEDYVGELNVPTNDQAEAVQPTEEAPRSHTGTPVESEPRPSLFDDDDLIDYTDEEEELYLSMQAAKQAAAHETSPSSATVRGDGTVNAAAVEHGSATGSPHATTEQEEQGDQSQDGLNLGAEEDPGVQSGDVQPENNDESTDLYLDFDENEPFHGFQADGAEEYPLETQVDGDANQGYADYEYGDLDQQSEADFMNGDEFNTAGGTTADGNDYTGTDDFLDFESTDWPADQELDTTLHVEDDSAYAQDEEDGAAEQTANATSPDADPATASSVDPEDASPQGQKRSIDEAGHGADIALDSIDAKRPRV